MLIYYLLLYYCSDLIFIIAIVIKQLKKEVSLKKVWCHLRNLILIWR